MMDLKTSPTEQSVSPMAISRPSPLASLYCANSIWKVFFANKFFAMQLYYARTIEWSGRIAINFQLKLDHRDYWTLVLVTHCTNSFPSCTNISN